MNDGGYTYFTATLRKSRGMLAGLALVGLIAFVVMGPYMAALSRPQAGGDVQRIHTSPARNGREVAVLAGGCFWAMQAMFQQLKGVDEVVPGYAGGHTQSPTYEDVCSHTTGHAESIRVVFDPNVISYHKLLTVFFSAHDPTTLNRQGDDEGTNYRSAIFYKSEEQKAIALQAIAETNRMLGGNRVVTQVAPLNAFFAAEEYHNNYFANHPDEPYCAEVVAPKVAKFRDHWHSILKS
jgi:peptide-methionine (S)-S-oxide reductase